MERAGAVVLGCGNGGARAAGRCSHKGEDCPLGLRHSTGTGLYSFKKNQVPRKPQAWPIIPQEVEWGPTLRGGCGGDGSRTQKGNEQRTASPLPEAHGDRTGF